MKYVATCFALLITVFPIAASAATAAELQAQLQVLTQQLAQMQQQRGSAPTLGACVTITVPIGPGSKGSNVTALQQFLARDPSIYPEGTVSGYYGALTTTAVQRFQVKYNIVSTGSPSTTGYGRVGPKTLEVINSMCGGSSNNVGAFMQVSPTSGDSPLQVNVQVTVNTTNSCAAATYTLDYGDQSAKQQIQVPAGTCQPLQQTYLHTYTQSALYNLTLASGSHSSGAQVVVQDPGTSDANQAQSSSGTTQTQSPGSSSVSY